MQQPIAIPTSSDEPLWHAWLAGFYAPALIVADDLGVFTALRARPATAAELAALLALEERATQALLGVMAGLGFVAQTPTGFSLTEVSRQYLLPESPFYWGGFLRRLRNRPIDCEKLLCALRCGQTQRMSRISGELWRAAAPPPEALRAFTHAMHAHSFALAMRVAPQLRFADMTRILDVGGGSGSYAIAGAYHSPGPHFDILDLPVVCDVAREYVDRFGVVDRVGFVAADMFSDRWPSAFDGVFFSDVFHDWDDADCKLLAARAYEALQPGGRILVHEMLLSDDKDGPLAAAAYSMVMLFATEGRQRTAGEIRGLLSGAGFTDPQVSPTAGGYALISARRP